VEKQYITQWFKSGGRKNRFLRFLIVAAVAFGLLLWLAYLGGEQPCRYEKLQCSPKHLKQVRVID
jgi:hypothetical protein